MNYNQQLIFAFHMVVFCKFKNLWILTSSWSNVCFLRLNGPFALFQKWQGFQPKDYQIKVLGKRREKINGKFWKSSFPQDLPLIYLTLYDIFISCNLYTICCTKIPSQKQTSVFMFKNKTFQRKICGSFRVCINLNVLNCKNKTKKTKLKTKMNPRLIPSSIQAEKLLYFTMQWSRIIISVETLNFKWK